MNIIRIYKELNEVVRVATGVPSLLIGVAHFFLSGKHKEEEIKPEEKRAGHVERLKFNE